MISVAEARVRAAKTLNRNQRMWAAGTGTDASMSISLQPPTEHAVLHDQAAARRWADEWRAVDTVEVEWGVRRWSSAGTQRIPLRCSLEGADQIAMFAGPQNARTWNRLRNRAQQLRTRFGDQEPLREAIATHGTAIERLDPDDFALLVHVLEWLQQYPTSGYRIRQIPIPGMHTKWLGTRRALVEDLHTAATGAPALGLIGPPIRVRLRVLDPEQRPGGLTDITAPVDELARLDLSPSTVYVFENLESVLAMPDLSGAIAVHGGGYALSMRDLPWVQGSRIVYWGDIDADGFAILNRLRSSGLAVESALMDTSALQAFRELCVTDPRGSVRRDLPHLTPAEHAAYEEVTRSGGLRLEQERLPWPFVLEALGADRGLPPEPGRT